MPDGRTRHKWVKTVQEFNKQPQLKELYVKWTLFYHPQPQWNVFLAGNIFRKNRAKLTDLHFEQYLLLKINAHLEILY